MDCISVVNMRESDALTIARFTTGRTLMIAALREKYDLHMTVERYVSVEENAEDGRFIRK